MSPGVDTPIMIMAGGTGGHVFPALAVAERLRARGIPVVWMGTRHGLEARVVPEAGIPMAWIAVSGIRGTGVWRRLASFWSAGAAVVQAGKILLRTKPRLALGMGGFVSGPGGGMAWLLGVPLLIHEQNAVPGMTNRWLSRIASKVMEAFPGSFPSERRAVLTGNPVRREIVALPDPEQRFEHRSGRFRLLVLGGSQGALVLNQQVPGALGLMPSEARPEVVHQAGAAMYEDAAEAYRRVGVEAHLVPFIKDMAEVYGWADLVVCRAGALTIAELAAAGLGSVLIPFPHAVDDHQTVNARHLERAGAAVVVPQSVLTAERLAEQLRALLRDRSTLLSMATAARSMACADAADRVAAICLEHAAPNSGGGGRV